MNVFEWLDKGGRLPPDDVIDEIAQAIYHHSGGMTDNDYFHATGQYRRVWNSGGAWDNDPEHELCEHERDDYRVMAKAAFMALFLSERCFLGNNNEPS
jgi:hypothetical protein